MAKCVSANVYTFEADRLSSHEILSYSFDEEKVREDAREIIAKEMRIKRSISHDTIYVIRCVQTVKYAFDTAKSAYRRYLDRRYNDKVNYRFISEEDVNDMIPYTIEVNPDGYTLLRDGQVLYHRDSPKAPVGGDGNMHISMMTAIDMNLLLIATGCNFSRREMKYVFSHILFFYETRSQNDIRNESTATYPQLLKQIAAKKAEMESEYIKEDPAFNMKVPLDKARRQLGVCFYEALVRDIDAYIANASLVDRVNIMKYVSEYRSYKENPRLFTAYSSLPDEARFGDIL